jgi:hypothetical protein
VTFSFEFDVQGIADHQWPDEITVTDITSICVANDFVLAGSGQIID